MCGLSFSGAQCRNRLVDGLQLVHAAQRPAKARAMPAFRPTMAGRTQGDGCKPQALLRLMYLRTFLRPANDTRQLRDSMHPFPFCIGHWFLVLATHGAPPQSLHGSPVSDGGRGLKLPPPPLWTKPKGGSPVSDGGRGLKHAGPRCGNPSSPKRHDRYHPGRGLQLRAQRRRWQEA